MFSFNNYREKDFKGKSGEELHHWIQQIAEKLRLPKKTIEKQRTDVTGSS
jgi:hypothetical protein